MADQTPRLYEGLFLINQQAIGGDLSGAMDHVRQMLDRAEAEILSLRKWDERKLAYPVKNQKRGIYVLSLFRVNPVQIANIERDCNLSDEVLRVLMTHAEHLGDAEIEQEQNAAQTSSDEAKMEAEGGDEAEQGGEGEKPDAAGEKSDAEGEKAEDENAEAEKAESSAS